MKLAFSIFLTFIAIFSNCFAKEKLKKVNINLIRLIHDNDFQEKKGYTGIILGKKYPQNRAILTAITENKIKLNVLGVRLILVEHLIEDSESFFALSKSLKNESIFILDLPEKILEKIIPNLPSNAAFFNARNSKNIFRQDFCKKNLFNIIPSDKMYTDAIAQFLVSKNWKKVMILYGSNERDKNKYLSFVDSSKKFKLKIIDEKKFTLSKNPSERKNNNLKLLTKGSKYDTIVVFDDFGEFRRQIPYKTFYPTPIIGDTGLSPRAWHWSWERNGGPQLNKRFRKNDFELSWEEKNRRMHDNDWAAWASIKIIIESLKIDRDFKKNGIIEILKNPSLAIDMYKGKAGTFRKWNNQLRQPILLSTHNAVIEKMPNKKFLHKENNEDTLGFDLNENKCKFN